MRIAELPNQQKIVHRRGHARRAVVSRGLGGARFQRPRQRQAGVILFTTLMVLISALTLSAIGLSRSTSELMISTRYAENQQAFYAAESGVTGLVRLLSRKDDLDCTDGIFCMRRDVQVAILQALNTTDPALPTALHLPDPNVTINYAAQLPGNLPGGASFRWCRPDLTIPTALQGRLFPVCVEGVAPDTTPHRIQFLLEMPSAGQFQGTGVMALSSVDIFEGTEIRGDVVILSRGDTRRTVFVGKGSHITTAADGTGGRIFLRDPNGELDLRAQAAGGSMPNILDELTNQLYQHTAWDPSGGFVPVLASYTGTIGSQFFPVVTHGDNVASSDRDALKQAVNAGEPVPLQLIQRIVESFMNSPYDLAEKIVRAEDAYSVEALAQLDEFARILTLPNRSNADQTPPIDMNGYPGVNLGDWRIVTKQDPPHFQLVDTMNASNHIDNPPVPLPGGVWVLKSVEVAKGGKLLFDDKARIYLTDAEAGHALNMHEDSVIGGADETDTNAVRIIVPCLARQIVSNVCTNMQGNGTTEEDFMDAGRCLDEPPAVNPDADDCTASSSGRVSIRHGITVRGSIHAPRTDVSIQEGSRVDGIGVVSNTLDVGKGVRITTPTGTTTGQGGGGSNTPADLTMRFWAYRPPNAD